MLDDLTLRFADGDYIAMPQIRGGEFQVNTTTASDQSFPAVTALNSGDYLVTWMSYNQDGSDWGIYGQRYGSDGSTMGGEFRINTTTTNNQIYPAVVALNDGGYLVTWMSENQDGSGYGIYGQRYDANGSTVGSEFQVNTTTTNEQWHPAVTVLNDGGYLVIWSSLTQDGSGWGIYGQRYAANGSAWDSEFQVNTTTASDQYSPAVIALNGGGYLVTWMSENQDGSGYGIYGQRYDANGQAVESVVQATINHAPVAAPVVLGSADEGSPGVMITASQRLSGTNDVDGDTVQITALSLNNPEHGQLTPELDGSWTFVPAANLNGPVVFNYTVSDGHASTSSSSANLTLTPVDNVPSIVDAIRSIMISNNKKGNTVSGENGSNDVLVGNNGNDHLFGGSGDNWLVGGKGKDIYHFSATDRVAGGMDRIVDDNGSLIAFDSTLLNQLKLNGIALSQLTGGKSVLGQRDRLQ